VDGTGGAGELVPYHLAGPSSFWSIHVVHSDNNNQRRDSLTPATVMAYAVGFVYSDRTSGKPPVLQANPYSAHFSSVMTGARNTMIDPSRDTGIVSALPEGGVDASQNENKGRQAA
jgi:hypothetical protein